MLKSGQLRSGTGSKAKVVSIEEFLVAEANRSRPPVMLRRPDLNLMSAYTTFQGILDQHHAMKAVKSRSNEVNQAGQLRARTQQTLRKALGDLHVLVIDQQDREVKIDQLNLEAFK